MFHNILLDLVSYFGKGHKRGLKKDFWNCFKGPQKGDLKKIF